MSEVEWCDNCGFQYVYNIEEDRLYCMHCLRFKPTDPPVDTVNHPPHYTEHPSGIECITITRHMNFNLGNVVKYIWRAGLKDEKIPVEDLQKAAWYLNDEIERRLKIESGQPERVFISEAREEKALFPNGRESDG